MKAGDLTEVGEKGLTLRCSSNLYYGESNSDQFLVGGRRHGLALLEPFIRR